MNAIEMARLANELQRFIDEQVDPKDQETITWFGEVKQEVIEEMQRAIAKPSATGSKS